jgi:hypothetical protein
MQHLADLARIDLRGAKIFRNRNVDADLPSCAR